MNTPKELEELDYVLIEAEFGIQKGDTVNGKPLLEHEGVWFTVNKFLESDKAKNYRSLISTHSNEQSRNVVKILHRNIDVTFNLIERIQPGYIGSPQIDARDLQKLLCDFQSELTKEEKE